MKIIETDNYGGDYPDGEVIACGIRDLAFAQVMADALNDKFCSSRFYRVVVDDYVLQPGFGS